MAKRREPSFAAFLAAMDEEIYNYIEDVIEGDYE